MPYLYNSTNFYSFSRVKINIYVCYAYVIKNTYTCIQANTTKNNLMRVSNLRRRIMPILAGALLSYSAPVALTSGNSYGRSFKVHKEPLTNKQKKSRAKEYRAKVARKQNW